MQSRFIDALGHQLHYLEWGTAGGANTIVMIHGLTRTSHDFVPLANYLHATRGYHCLSFDVIGRGLSTWAPTSEAVTTQYAIPFYIQLFATIFGSLNLSNAYYIGTSMGGIIGFIGLGSGAFTPFISKLVINDIGPYVPMNALRNIGRYTATMPVHSTATEVLEDVRKRMATFGTFTADQFSAFAVPYVRRLENGKFTFHYDERILEGIRKILADLDAPQGAEAVLGVPAEVTEVVQNESDTNSQEKKMREAAEPLWSLFGAIKVPILIFRGVNSELLLPQDAERMVAMHEGRASIRVVPNCGHAPMLVDEADMVAIADFLS